MNINRDNYESHFIDYLDGCLTSKEAGELYAFLLLNDDLREELEDLEQIKLHPTNIKYTHHLSLKKNELHACPDYYGIATAEQCLTPQDIKFLKKHPDYQNTASIYRKMKLNPDPAIHFTHKKQLYRPKGYMTTLMHLSAVAAILCLLLGIRYYMTSDNEMTEENRLATTLYYPAIPPVEVPDLLPVNPTETGESPKKTEKTVIKIILKEKIRQADPGLMTIYSPPIAPIALNQTSSDYSLITSTKRRVVIQAEIFLAETAATWKPSERNILSDNIFNSMISAGKTLADKIKSKE